MAISFLQRLKEKLQKSRMAVSLLQRLKEMKLKVMELKELNGHAVFWFSCLGLIVFYNWIFYLVFFMVYVGFVFMAYKVNQEMQDKYVEWESIRKNRVLELEKAQHNEIIEELELLKGYFEAEYDESRQEWEHERSNLVLELEKEKAQHNEYIEELECLRSNFEAERKLYYESRQEWKHERSKLVLELEKEKAQHEKDVQNWESQRSNFEEEKKQRKLDGTNQETAIQWRQIQKELSILSKCVHELKNDKTKYIDERKEWEHNRSNLVAELDTVRKCANLYKSILHENYYLTEWSQF